MAATDQWCFCAIGLTKSVQPYCRLAIMIMQITPATSCVQRSRPMGLPILAVATLAMFRSWVFLLLLWNGRCLVSDRGRRCAPHQDGFNVPQPLAAAAVLHSAGENVTVPNASGPAEKAIDATFGAERRSRAFPFQLQA